MPKSQQQAFINAVECELAGVDYFSPGTSYECEACNPDGLEEDELDNAGEFSWCVCDSCGSTLGGNRYSAHGFIDDDLTHFDICEDCLLYHANGDLPDTYE